MIHSNQNRIKPLRLTCVWEDWNWRFRSLRAIGTRSWWPRFHTPRWTMVKRPWNSYTVMSKPPYNWIDLGGKQMGSSGDALWPVLLIASKSKWLRHNNKSLKSFSDDGKHSLSCRIPSVAELWLTSKSFSLLKTALKPLKRKPCAVFSMINVEAWSPSLRQTSKHSSSYFDWFSRRIKQPCLFLRFCLSLL